MVPGFRVHLRNEGAGGIQHEHVATLGIGRHRLRNTVCRKDQGASPWDFVEFLHENGTFRLQVVDDMPVVNDLVALHTPGAVLLQRQLHNLDRTIHPGAEAAGGSDVDLQAG